MKTKKSSLYLEPFQTQYMHRIPTLVIYIFCIFFSSIFIVACKGKAEAERPRENPPTVVDVMIAATQPVDNTIEANGSVTANETVELRPEVSGRLTYLNVPEGKHVTKGTVLARINSSDLQAQLQKSRAQLDLAKLTQQRLKTLLDVGGVNQADYDLAVNNVNNLQADMAYTQTLIDKTVIRAPFSGTIGLRQVSPGAYVSPASVIATIQQLSKAKIDFTLPEQYSNLVKIGNSVAVEVDAANEVRERATIIALEPQAIRETRNIVVRALLEKSTPNPGAFVKVYVNTSTIDQRAIMVPTNTIIPDDKNNQVILVKGGKASFVNVQTGFRNAGNVELTKGVNEGDTIVVTGVLFARPKAPLRIRSVKTLEQLAEAR